MKSFVTVYLFFISISINAQVWTRLFDDGTPKATYHQNEFMTTDIEFALNQDTTPYTVEFGIGTSTDGTGWIWYPAVYDHQDGNNRHWIFTDDNSVQFTSVGNWYYAARFVETSTHYADAGWQENHTILNAIAYFQVEAPLPVELTSFSAFTNGENVSLNWQTATEVNNFGFEIQRQNLEQNSQNADWGKVGFVNGSGNSNSSKLYSFTDNSVKGGKYSYRLKQIDIDGSFEYSQIVEVDLEIPSKFELKQNYPNPFNPTTTISYAIPLAEIGYDLSVQLKIYNSLGKEIATLVNKEQGAGNYNIQFDASKLSSGIYYYTLITEKYSSTKKMLMIK